MTLKWKELRENNGYRFTEEGVTMLTFTSATPKGNEIIFQGQHGWKIAIGRKIRTLHQHEKSGLMVG